jgi:hypothetical protein
MLYRLLLLLVLAITVSVLPWAKIGKAEAPTDLEKFKPSQKISVDNAVAFPVDI